jgi:uncharacterized protein YndB with AHSA1/START domain
MSASPKRQHSENCEHVLTRVFDAPRELLWKVWTDPKLLSQWWGPNHFTTPVCEMDVRPGGAYRIVMRSQDGIDYPLKGRYDEVVPPKLLVYTVDMSEHPAEWHEVLAKQLEGQEAYTSRPALCRVTFDDEGGKTRLTVRSTFDSSVLRDAFVRMGMETGWSQMLDKLASLLNNG